MTPDGGWESPDLPPSHHPQIGHSDSRTVTDDSHDPLRLLDQSANIRASYEAGRLHPWAHTPRRYDQTEVRRLRDAGLLYREIAAVLGCSISHAHRLASEGVVTNHGE